MTQARQKGSDPGSDPFAGIADLDLVARIIVDGLVSGPHRSPFHGYSAEFSQYRHYQPGDDLKYVDWKLVARTDRVYTKQFRETTNMAASFVVDASASMAFPADERRTQKSQNTQSQGLSASSASSAREVPSVSKFRYAAIVAAALAHLVSRQGDAVGLVTGGESQDRFLPPRTGRQHLRRVLAALSALKAAGSWTAGPIIRRAAERLKRRGLLIVLSDFYDDEDEAFAELRRAARMGHDVVVFQIVSRIELEFPYARDVEFADLETGQTIVVNADAARRDYTDVVSAFAERCRKRATAEGIQYSLVVTDTPPEHTLRHFLLARR
jgi:uncharacterized protein (DUF58 family)